MFKPVSAKVNFFKEQEKILDFWKTNKIFEKSVNQRSQNNPFSFYDGPPFVTGYPHYGGLLSSIAKDVFPRYQAMKGKRVRRVWGWDCHGLPIENVVEKKLGLKNRREIIKFGVNKFVSECQCYVEETSPEWKWYIDHIGRWVDFENAYKTMDLSYMESVIWVFKQLYDQGLIYKGDRVSLFCPRCSTPVSNFEIAMDDSYATVKDPAITIKFKISDGKHKGCFLLAWTTTPWTLPSNRALVVDEKEKYIKTKDGLILAKKRAGSLKGVEFPGKELLGNAYEPLYNFFPPNKNDFKIYHFEGMVNMEEGTGVVHSAPGFGEIDTQMGNHYGLTLMKSVDDEGKFIDKLGKWAGLYVKDADKEVIKDLKQRGLLYKEETISHRYPFCYRCESPLIYKAQESWFIDVQKLKESLLKTNKLINWVPFHFKLGRFKKGIESAPDWCISRTRYWATVMPVWKCEKCQELEVVGSIKEIEEKGEEKVTDLHRPGVDHIKFKCKCGGKMSRIPEVLDCWMESGAMPYAERHYPFENKAEFEKSFPADFISEYSGQVRAWFYVLHVLSNAIFDSPSFKNVVVTGVIAGTDGRKMSKSYKNYPDPRDILEKFGGDALRLYLMGSPIMDGKDTNISEGKEIESEVKTYLLPLWNCFRYFVTFANLYNWQPGKKKLSGNILDKWVLSRLNFSIAEIEKALDSYKTPLAVKELKSFVDDLSRWFIRRSRDRLNKGDKQALSTLYQVLEIYCKISAPIVPFIAENIYKNLTHKTSVHLEDWPEAGAIDNKLLEEMVLVRQICELGHAARKNEGLKVRQPLAEVIIKNCQSNINSDLERLIIDELNVKEVAFKQGKGDLKVTLDLKITPLLKAEGEARDLVRQVQDLRKKCRCDLKQKIIIFGPDLPDNKIWQDYLKNETLAIDLKPAKTLAIEPVKE